MIEVNGLLSQDGLVVNMDMSWVLTANDRLLQEVRSALSIFESAEICRRQWA